jgi:hypothetical protein
VNNYWAFLPMRDSNDLLGDPEALRARLEQDSYLLLRGVLDTRDVLALRHDIVSALAEVGWVRGGRDLMEGIATGAPCREGEPEFFVGNDAVQRLERFHGLAHRPELLELMRQVVGPSAFPHPLKIARLSFPEHYEISTPPHQDYPNNQGTETLTAAWVPVGDCPRSLGGLAVLRGSHRYGVLPLDRHMAAGMRCAVIPEEMLEELRWVTTDFRTGDVLLFPSTTVHAALHNCSEFNMRISVDFRYQLEGEPLTPIVLEPHFRNLTWAQVYEGWSSTELQYYWRDLDYEVVEFDDFELVSPADDQRDLDALQGYMRRNAARRERRGRRLAEADGGRRRGRWRRSR